MKIIYVHHEKPNVEKTLDTHKIYKETYLPFVDRFLPGTTPQSEEEWTKGELARLDKKVEQGIILSYRIVEGGM
jgi:hypothetical protein